VHGCRVGSPIEPRPQVHIARIAADVGRRNRDVGQAADMLQSGIRRFRALEDRPRGGLAFELRREHVEHGLELLRRLQLLQREGCPRGCGFVQPPHPRGVAEDHPEDHDSSRHHQPQLLDVQRAQTAGLRLDDDDGFRRGDDAHRYPSSALS
jgi:hypothetical protein